jgi:hypothetical protein
VESDFGGGKTGPIGGQNPSAAVVNVDKSVLKGKKHPDRRVLPDIVHINLQARTQRSSAFSLSDMYFADERERQEL